MRGAGGTVTRRMNLRGARDGGLCFAAHRGQAVSGTVVSLRLALVADGRRAGPLALQPLRQRQQLACLRLAAPPPQPPAQTEPAVSSTLAGCPPCPYGCVSWHYALTAALVVDSWMRRQVWHAQSSTRNVRANLHRVKTSQPTGANTSLVRSRASLHRIGPKIAQQWVLRAATGHGCLIAPFERAEMPTSEKTIKFWLRM